MKFGMFLLLASIAWPQSVPPEFYQRPKSMVKTSHVGPTTVVIACVNGGDPTVIPTKAKGVLIVSCGTE